MIRTVAQSVLALLIGVAVIGYLFSPFARKDDHEE